MSQLNRLETTLVIAQLETIDREMDTVRNITQGISTLTNMNLYDNLKVGLEDWESLLLQKKHDLFRANFINTDITLFDSGSYLIHVGKYVYKLQIDAPWGVSSGMYILVRNLDSESPVDTSVIDTEGEIVLTAESLEAEVYFRKEEPALINHNYGTPGGYGKIPTRHRMY